MLQFGVSLTVLVDVVAWGLVHAGTGYFVHRIPTDRLGDAWLFRLRPFENGGRVYEDRFRIKRWKDRVPEAGSWFRGGVSKRSLPALADGGVARFVVETRRAELGHCLAAAAGPLFAIWNPPVATALLIAYGVIVNVPFIMIQRYNRGRALRVLGRDGVDRSKMSDDAARARARVDLPGRSGSSIP